jgi:prepilin-type N-terminal cleavage/methylation domain-containing protein
MSEPAAASKESGMTLVELLIVLTILLIIVVPMASVLTVGLIIPAQEQQRLADTGDAQLLQSFFVNDVQSASTVDTSGINGSCSNSSTLLQLTDTNYVTTTSTVVRTIDYAPDATGRNLIRYYCDGSTSNQVTVITSPQQATFACTTATCSVNVIETGNAQGAKSYQVTLSATRRDFAIS